MKKKLVTIALALGALTSCDSPKEVDSSIQIAGTVAHMPPSGLPEGTRLVVLWDTHDAAYSHEIMRVGSEGVLDRTTGSYSIQLAGNLPANCAYAPMTDDTLGVGYVVLTTDTTPIGAIAPLGVDTSFLGALVDHNIVYRRGSFGATELQGFRDFNQGYSLGVTVLRKPVSKDLLRPVGQPQGAIEYTHTPHFADWH